MLVSANIPKEARSQAVAGKQPWSEYLVLEADHDVRLLDWRQLRGGPTRRSSRVGVEHALAALPEVRSTSGYLTDSEHVGLPLAAALALTPNRPTHVMIAHHLNTRSKQRLLRLPRVASSVDAFVVHSDRQVEALTDQLGLPRERVHLVPYGVDTQFWAPWNVAQLPLLVSPGREHRDHATLAQAVDGLEVSVFVTDGSSHSPAARRTIPDQWPANIERGSLPLSELAAKYASSSVVVVPLVETDFPAGITVIAEAMSMGKAVVASATTGLRGAVADPEEAIVWVPPGNARALRAAVESLLADPERRAALGRRARQVALEHHDVRRFASSLAALLGSSPSSRKAEQ